MFSEVKLNIEQTQTAFGYDPSTLSEGSHQKVYVECLNCHRIIAREYRNSNRKHQCPIVQGNTKKCFKCSEWKDLSLFNKNPRLSGGVSKMCRQCHNNHESVIKCEYRRKSNLRNLLANGDIEKYIKRRTYALKSQTRKNGINFNISSEYLSELWSKQKGLCYYTKLPMTASMKQNGFQAWNGPSVDRKTPELGYVEDNVVWCIFAVNSFKQCLDEKLFAEMLTSIQWWNERQKIAVSILESI